ncbi:GntR family transcriptional regulator [Miniphocaeibacter halophilus]|uniref:GntR family transcriptional regulator n=1 Tax=Miniphocaeibacter halophilus TaxID=2931922 RepID=A0AC61MXN4_9FIRM|nr:GntR family transcriptional regulator [Miniphocaeibacter halophilus]QQK08640.1 GntR family transcriptional regulator [Miniphocaeibacter halophilus]
MVNLNLKIPRYAKVAADMEEKINSGVWEKGSIIPSEKELEKIYGVSRTTIRKAVSELESNNKLRKVQGKGTFVTLGSIIQNLKQIYVFSEEMRKLGKVTSTVFVGIEVIKDPKIAKKLSLNENEEIIELKRLRCDESDEALMYERTYFSKLEHEYLLKVDWNSRQLYKFLEEEANIHIDRATERFKACSLTVDEAKKLGAKVQDYGLLIRRLSYSNNKIISYSIITAKGDSFEFEVELKI